MKKIAFFTLGLKDGAGIERVCTVIANSLYEKGYDVSIITLNEEKSFFPLHDGIKVFYLSEEKIAILNHHIVPLVFQLRRLNRRECFDVIIDINVVLSLIGFCATIGSKTKIFTWEHFHFFVAGAAKRKFNRTAVRKVVGPLVDKVITLTERDAVNYKKHSFFCKNKVVTIPNPVTVRQLESPDLSRRVVLAVGRLTRQKGFDYLLEIWEKVTGNFPEWKLWIVGDGEEKERLLQQCHTLGLSDSVAFFPPTDDIESFYGRASIFALTSRFEGLVLVLLEAKSCGLPAVSFDCDYGPREIVHDGLDGFLVPPGDLDGFAAKLSQLMQSRELREQLSTNAKADKRFSLESVLAQWAEILK